VNNENWKIIERTGGRYSVSETGKIRSNERITIRIDGKPMPVHEKIMKPHCDLTGYRRCDLAGYGTCKVHREVAMAFIDNPRNLPEVNHKDGNKTNNSIDNLEWVTHQENARHAHANGMVHHPSKLSTSDVIAIRQRYIPFSKEHGTNAIAKNYGVCSSYIWRIIANQKRANCGRDLSREATKGGE